MQYFTIMAPSRVDVDKCEVTQSESENNLFVIQHLAIQAVVISFLSPEASYFVAIS